MTTRWAQFVLFSLAVSTGSASAADWPRFRGPNGSGIADDKNIPVQWTDGDYSWKVELPGKGHSSPIVSWGKIFLESSSDDLKARYLVCIDAKSGRIDWSKPVSGGTTRTHPKNSPASSTPAADSDQIYAVFWDGQHLQLCAFDYEGNQKWQHDLGTFRSDHGAGLSPIVVGNKVIVNVDQGDGKSPGRAELQAFDAKTGERKWSAKRDPERACYSTPFLLEKPSTPPSKGEDRSSDASDLIVCSTGGVTAYDPKDGKEIWNFNWNFDRMRLRTVGSPIFHQGLIFAVAGDGGGDRNMVAIKSQGKGDVSATSLVWQKKKYTPYVPSPIAKDGLIFWVTDKENIAYCVDAQTGAMIWNERLGGGDEVSASPIMIDGKIYVINEKGTVFVFAAAKTFELLGKSEVGEKIFATPAVADGRLYIRGAKHLYCLAAKSK